MLGFNKWKEDNCVKHCNLCFIGVCGKCTGIGTKEDVWRSALKWYQDIVNTCEKDCNTDEDYKILYFHLKQVLINEIKE